MLLIDTYVRVSNARGEIRRTCRKNAHDHASLRKVRGRAFESGNPGRPLGSKNKVTQILEQLAEEQAEQLVQKALELAQAGDVSYLKMLLDRLWPARKAPPISVPMPPINSSQDVFPAIASIWTAIREGRLTPDEVTALSIVIERSIQAIEPHDILKRITALEEARDKRDATKNPPPA